MIQRHLFNNEPLARTTDPLSSHDAARRVHLSAGTQSGLILLLLKQQGCAMTAQQIADELEMDAYVVRKRLPSPLEKRGYVKAINRETLAPGDTLRWLAVEGK